MKQRKFFLFPILFFLAISLTTITIPPKQARLLPDNVEAINLDPGVGTWSSLSDDEFDPAVTELYTEFIAGTEDDPLARERWFWEQRAYPKDYIPVKVHNAAVMQELSAAPRKQSAVVWTNLGPAPLNDITYAGQSAQDASGRALSVAVHPSNGNVIFVGAAQGGIWKSTDGGSAFSSVSDNMPSLAIKVIRFAPSISNTMYAGTGEPHASTGIYGRGVLKSTDGGDTWTQLPVSGAGWDFEYVSISGLQVHPTDPNTLYVTTAHIRSALDYFNPTDNNIPTTGVFKSTDGGQTWTLLKQATDYDAPTSSLDQNIGFMDLELAQSNPNLLYATEYFGGIWKSTDGGANWTRITPMKDTFNEVGADFPATVSAYSYFSFSSSPEQANFFVLNRFALNSSIPEFSRIEIGLAQSDPNVLYAGYAVDFLLLDADGDGIFTNNDIQTSVGLIFKTTDGGSTWAWLGDWSRNGIPNYCGTQCSYDNTVEVNPGDANDVIIGGNANYNSVWPDPLATPTRYLGMPWRGMVYRSLNGGSAWVDTTPHCTNISGSPTATFAGLDYYPCLTNNANQVIHPDVHGAVYDPTNANRLYISNDGGLYRATVSNTGGSSTDYTWENLNNNLSTLQFYLFDAHPTDPNIILGGLQDNSNAYWNGSVWEGWGFGDGMLGAFDPNDPKRVYMGTQFNVHRHDNGGAKEALDSNGQPANNWNLSIFSSSKVQSGESVSFLPVFEVDPAQTGTVYGASNIGLYRSTNYGDTWGSRLNASDTDSAPTTVSVSPAGNNNVWLGTNAGSVYLFNISGGTNSKVDKSPLPDRYITKIEASPGSAATAYVTFSGYDANTPATPGKVFKTTNSGSTWTDISGNLPDVPVSAFAIDPNNEDRMWVGTDIGVYISEDGGANWTSYRNNMPVVAIMDLKYNAVTDYLMAATHGRGMWRVQPTSAPTAVSSVSISASASGVISKTQTFNAAVSPTGATTPITYSWEATGQTPVTNTGQGNSNSVSFTWYVTGTKTVTVSADNGQGSPVSNVHTIDIQGDSGTTLIYLPLIVKNYPEPPSPEPSGFKNADFESGNNGDWTESSTNFATLITNLGFSFSAYSGSWLAWMGGASNEDSQLSQNVKIPSNMASVYINFYYRVSSAETNCSTSSPSDYLLIYVDGTSQGGWVACDNFSTSSWALRGLPVDLSSYAGQTVNINFRMITDSSLTSSYFIEDVSFEKTAARPAASQTAEDFISRFDKP